jgi:hypothetical protein
MANRSLLLGKTLQKLRVLYEKYSLESGFFVKAGLNQGWNVVTGTRGQYGGSAGMIPDVLFAPGVHRVHSSRVSDPPAFERGMMDDMNMEAVMQSTQEHQAIRPSASRPV